MRILRMDSTTGACAEFELDSDGVFTFIEGDQSLIKDTDHVMLPGSKRVCVLGMGTIGASDSRIIIDDVTITDKIPVMLDFIRHCIHISAMHDYQYLHHTQSFKPKHRCNPRFSAKGNPFKQTLRSVNRNR